MSQKAVINMNVDIFIKTLRERVYGCLKEQISTNGLREGGVLDLKEGAEQE